MSIEQFLWDAHTHSNCSDSLEYPPKRVVETAKEKKVNVISLNDHDTDSGCEEAIRAGEKSNVLVIPGGVEVTSMYIDDITGKEGIEVHILGYGIKELEKLDELLAPTRAARKDRIDAILAIYSHVLGHAIELESKDSATKTRETVRQSISDEAIRTEFMKDTSWGQTSWIPYKEGSLMSTVEALDMQKEYCKLRILAHPGRLIEQYEIRLKNRMYPGLAEEAGIDYSLDKLKEAEAVFKQKASVDEEFKEKYEKTRQMIEDQLYSRSVEFAVNLVQNHGLNGFEVYYPDHNPEMVRLIRRVIHRLRVRYNQNLLITLGSDFGHKDKGIATGKNNNLLQYQKKKDCVKFLDALGLEL